MSFISDEMEKILEEEQMMESFTRNAEHELQKMFDMVQEEEGQERAVHKKMVGSLCDVLLKIETRCTSQWRIAWNRNNVFSGVSLIIIIEKQSFCVVKKRNVILDLVVFCHNKLLFGLLPRSKVSMKGERKAAKIMRLPVICVSCERYCCGYLSLIRLWGKTYIIPAECMFSLSISSCTYCLILLHTFKKVMVFHVIV